MKNYFRAVKQSFRRRGALVFTCIFFALMIGVLWGGGIAAIVYPVMEICLKKDSTFLTWLDLKIEENDQKIAEIEEKIAQLESDSSSHSSLIAAEQQLLPLYQLRGDWYRWSRPYVEQYTPSRPFQTVVFLMVIVLTVTVIRIFFLVSHTILTAMITHRTIKDIREVFYKKALDYEANYYSKEGVANAMSRFTTDMGVLGRGISVIYGSIIREPMKLIACLVIAACISWQLLLVTILLVPPAAWAIRWLAKAIKRVVRTSLEQVALLFSRLQETFQSVKIVKAFTQESYEHEKFRLVNEACYKRDMKIAKYDAFTNPIIELFGIAMVCVGVIVGTYLVMGDRTDIWGIPMLREPMKMEMLILFFAMLVGASDPARRLSSIFTQFQSAAAAADRIYAMIDRKALVCDTENPLPMPKHQESIRFENISFEYDINRPVLKDVSLEIKFGETIAILGASGCGKSTLLNLIPRFADAQKGKILIDGVDTMSVRLLDLRQQIGLVTQDPVLFNETVRENIRYGRSDATDEEIIEAAKKGFAHDFIENELPNGYDTMVGPSGGLLSGGQRQRIALARAVLRNPPILLLDEATSQIDILSEQKIHEALSAFKQGRTLIMITHRLSAVELADRIVLMDEGKIVALGTHEELMQTSPEYQKLM